MVLIQVLLPTHTPRGVPVGRDVFDRCRTELAERFGGLTAYLRSPAQGLWTAPSGEQEHDSVVMVEVVAEEFDRTWWRAYERTLAERFEQDVIHVRAIPTELLDEHAR
jgi:hypothetical protein